MVASSASLNQQRDNPGLGIATFVGNLVVMALISAAVRELVERDYPLGELLLLRYLFASMIFLTILLYTSGLQGFASKRPLDHGIRSVSGVLSLSLFYFAITRIPIADATAIAYAAPIFITVLSIFLLGESIGMQRWVSVIVGFFGVLLIARPAGGSWDVGVIAAAVSAFAGAIVAIYLRKLSSSEKPATIGTYYNSLGTLICLVWVLFSGWVSPREQDLILLSGFALACGIQQWLLTVSFRYAEASLLAPFEYLAMVFAAIVGFLFWNEIPVLTTWIGAAFIAGSGLYIFVRRQKVMPGKPPVEPVVIE